MPMCSLDTANELFGHELFNVVDVDEGAFHLSSPVAGFSDDEYEDEVGRELWPPSPHSAIPTSPYGSPFIDTPSSPYEIDPQTTSQLLDGSEFEKVLKFSGLHSDELDATAGSFLPQQPAMEEIIHSDVSSAAPTAGHAAAASCIEHTTPIVPPANVGTRSLGSSESKIRKSKYRTPPLLPLVRAAIDKVRKEHQSVSHVAATTMHEGKPLISERTLRRCVEQSQQDPTSVFYYPLLKMETYLKTGRKNKRHMAASSADKYSAGAASTLSDRYSTMTVKQLKCELRSRGLKLSGRKSEQQQRLREADRQKVMSNTVL